MSAEKKPRKRPMPRTPGDWVVKDSVFGYVFVETSKFEVRVATMSSRTHRYALGDAHLMAAAPGLLDELKRCLEDLDVPTHQRVRIEEMIAKAEGRG